MRQTLIRNFGLEKLLGNLSDGNKNKVETNKQFIRKANIFKVIKRVNRFPHLKLKDLLHNSQKNSFLKTCLLSKIFVHMNLFKKGFLICRFTVFICDRNIASFLKEKILHDLNLASLQFQFLQQR